MNRIPMPVSQAKVFFLTKVKKEISGLKYAAYMTGISEEEEALIDELGNRPFEFKRGGRTFTIRVKDIYFYGEVDLTYPDDIDLVRRFDFIKMLGKDYVTVWSRYDYATHTCLSPRSKPLWCECSDPLIPLQYAHGVLGKPKRVLVFNQTYK